MDKKRKRFEQLEKRPIHMDSFFADCVDIGLVAMSSPYDPKPSIKIRNNVIVEMDGKNIEEFDSIEMFISRYSINTELAKSAMELTSEDIARMIVDINVSREDVIAVTTAITPAKMLEVLNCLNTVEMMMGQQKMRRRETPANQAIVTNVQDNPVLMAADAAEAALRGFAELETTCAVSRYAPLNAISIMVGGMSVRPGILTQCSMEEALEVKMGMKGITSYAETISFYGTEKAMDDGNDTVWSKGFLSSIYASRGIKMRCTSGTGSEVLLGHSHKKSMLYLELLCVYMAKGCGVQGVQNGSISCIGITSSVSEGFLAMAAENLAVSLMDMEVASGNDQTFTHSDIRRTAKLLMQLLPGTDFITSGYSAVPNFDDVFAGSNTDCDDYDDWYMIQRDMQIDGGIEPVTEPEVLNARNRAAKALQAVFNELGFPVISDEEVEAAVYAYSNEEMPRRNMTKDLNAARDFFDKKYTSIDVIKALHNSGFNDVAGNILATLKERIGGDYLQTSAIFDKNLNVLSGLNDPNTYQGPGTGYRIDDERWEKLADKESAIIPEDILKIQRKTAGLYGQYRLKSNGSAGNCKADVTIGVSPGFCNYKLGLDICKNHYAILEKIMEAITENGLSGQIIMVHDTADLAEIARKCTEYSNSGVAIALQINGRAYICDINDKQPEEMKGFFNMEPSSTEDYSKVGEAAVLHAKGNPDDVVDIVRGSVITEYQLKMVKLSADDEEFVRKNKMPEIMGLAEE